MPTQNRTMIDAGLKKAGFGGLNDPTLFDQIAYALSKNGERHMHNRFRSMLLSAEPDKRKVAYDSIAPKLHFKALPLEDYIRRGAQEAEQKQLPHYDPNTLTITEWTPQTIETKEYKDAQEAARKIMAQPEREFVPTKPAQTKLEEHSSRAIAASLREENAKGQLYLVCRKCTREQRFRGKRRDHMVKMARQEGWYVSPQEILCIFCKPRLQ